MHLGFSCFVGELGERGGRGAVGVRPDEDLKERLYRRHFRPSGERHKRIRQEIRDPLGRD